MDALYRNRIWLPSLLLGLLAGCDNPPPPKMAAEPIPNVYLEAMQEAEALKHEVEERNRQQQQIDALLGQTQPAAR